MRSTFIKTLLVLAAGVVALAGPSGKAFAQTGTINGQIDGKSFSHALSGEALGYPAGSFDFAADGRRSALDVMMMALEESGDQIAGAMLFINLRHEGDILFHEMTPDMLGGAMLMVVDQWKKGEPDPSRVWVADDKDGDGFSIETLMLSEEEGVGRIAGTVRGKQFCLNDASSGDPVPVERNGAPVCKAGEVSFRMSIGDVADIQARPRGSKVEVEVLGRLRGTVGDQAHEWMTILPARGDSSARFERLDGQALYLDVTAHSPSSEDFLRQGVLSINVLGESVDGLPLNTPVPAEVTYFIEGTSVFYSAQDGDGKAEAVVHRLDIDADAGHVELEVSGRFCRVENFKLIADDCLPFQVSGETEVIHDAPD